MLRSKYKEENQCSRASSTSGINYVYESNKLCIRTFNAIKETIVDMRLPIDRTKSYYVTSWLRMIYFHKRLRGEIADAKFSAIVIAIEKP